MSEQIHDQVSAFLDDELSSEECAFLVRRLERDPEARDKLARYSTIGSVLRREVPLPDPQLLRRRVQEAMSGTPSAAAPAQAAAGGMSAARSRWANPAFGVGIAATVAIAALFTVRTVNETAPGRIDSAFSAPVRAAATSSNSPSYVVPPGARNNQIGQVVAPPPIRLTNYLMHHSEFASRLSRTSVNSNVVGAAVVQTIAETSTEREDSEALPPDERVSQ